MENRLALWACAVMTIATVVAIRLLYAPGADTAEVVWNERSTRDMTVIWHKAAALSFGYLIALTLLNGTKAGKSFGRSITRLVIMIMFIAYALTEFFFATGNSNEFWRNDAYGLFDIWDVLRGEERAAPLSAIFANWFTDRSIQMPLVFIAVVTGMAHFIATTQGERRAAFAISLALVVALGVELSVEDGFLRPIPGLVAVTSLGLLGLAAFLLSDGDADGLPYVFVGAAATFVSLIVAFSVLWGRFVDPSTATTGPSAQSHLAMGLLPIFGLLTIAHRHYAPRVPNMFVWGHALLTAIIWLYLFAADLRGGLDGMPRDAVDDPATYQSWQFQTTQASILFGLVILLGLCVMRRYRHRPARPRSRHRADRPRSTGSQQAL